MRHVNISTPLLMVASLVTFSARTAMADEETVLAEQALAAWDRLTFGVIVYPGCTAPHIEGVTIDRAAGTITHIIDGVWSEPVETTTEFRLDEARARKISESLLKHYLVAVAEESISEQLEELGDDEAAKAQLMKKHPPGIGGYRQELLAFTAKSGDKKFKVSQEFDGSAGAFLAWLRTLPKPADPDAPREQTDGDG